MKQIIIISLLLYTCICFASVYMEKQVSGGIIYSDTPSTNSQKINIPTSKHSSESFQTSPSLTTSASTPLPVDASQGSYKIFSIISPKDKATFQNQASIPVQIKLDPELRKTDKIQLLVDNKLWGSPQSTVQLSLDQVERGSHEVNAVILDANQKILQQSNSVTIFVHRVNTHSRPS